LKSLQYFDVRIICCTPEGNAVGTEVSPVKSEVIGSLRQDPVKRKIIVFNKFLPVQIFKYLGGEILYEN